jgi:hypothetical protein
VDVLSINLAPEEYHVRVTAMLRRNAFRSVGLTDVLLGLYRIEYPAIQFLALAADAVAKELGFSCMFKWEPDEWYVSFSAETNDAVWTVIDGVEVELVKEGRHWAVPVTNEEPLIEEDAQIS